MSNFTKRGEGGEEEEGGRVGQSEGKGGSGGRGQTAL